MSEKNNYFTPLREKNKVMTPIVASNVECNFTEQLFLHMLQLTVIRQTLKGIERKRVVLQPL